MIDFVFFLDKESPNDLINKPHRIPPYTYYSNGYYIIAKLTDDYGTIPFDTNQEFLKALKKFPVIGGKRYKAPPQYDQPKVFPCENCSGTGYVEDCPECDAHGHISFQNEHNSYEIECQTCDGNEHVPSKKDNEYAERCNQCDGAGKYNQWGDNNADQLLSIGGFIFDKNLLEMLKLLPLFAIQSSDPDQLTLQFSFFGGKGILMNMGSSPETAKQ